MKEQHEKKNAFNKATTPTNKQKLAYRTATKKLKSKAVSAKTLVLRRKKSKTVVKSSSIEEIQRQPPEVLLGPATEACNFIKKKRPWHRCFPANFAKFLRPPFLPWNSGITWKKISCYMRDSACKWLIAKNAKIFQSHIKHL